MDTNIINECKSLSLAGKITFPEVVMKLATTGVERYIIDLVGLKGLYYDTKINFILVILILVLPQSQRTLI